MINDLDPEVFRNAADEVLSAETFACNALRRQVIASFGDLSNVTQPVRDMCRARADEYTQYFEQWFRPLVGNFHGAWWLHIDAQERMEKEEYDRQEARALALQLTALFLEEEQESSENNQTKF